MSETVQRLLAEVGDTGHPVAIMDGSCALCCFGARMIDRLDRSGKVRICTVQSPLGAALLARHGLRAGDPESWLLIEGDRTWQGFAAMIRLGERAGGWGRLLLALRLLPGPVARWLYAWIARNRYAVFGRGDLCALPSPSLRARLIG